MTDTTKQAKPAPPGEPVAWVVRIKKTHEFGDPTELYGDTAEEAVEKSMAWNSEYSEPEQLYSADQVRELQLKAIRAALELAREKCYEVSYGSGAASSVRSIDTQTILENLK